VKRTLFLSVPLGNRLFSRELREKKSRAGEATRTPDIFLGKEVLYQLSYTRVLPIGGRNDASEACGIKKYLSAAG
jgi:hypothetical protein